MIVVCVRLLGDKLDEVATRVVEDGHDGAADVRRRLREHHALSGQPDVLGVDVVDGELSEWNAVLNECIPIWLHGRVARRLQQEFWAVGRFGRHDRKPRIAADGDVPALGEAEHVGVEGEGCSLVVDENTCQADSH
jgi:hypothetical protein